MQPLNDFVIQMPSDIKEELRRIDREIPIPRNLRFAPNHIFDLDQTVRWNQEEVERRNKEAEKAVRDAQEARRISNENLKNAIIDFIIANSCKHMTRQIAAAVIEHAANIRSDDWCEWLEDVIDYTDWVLDTILK